MATFHTVLKEFRTAVDVLVKASDASKEFKRREIFAVEKLRRDVEKIVIDASEMSDGSPLVKRLHAARIEALEMLGSPGDFGYESSEGSAMQRLYDLCLTVTE